MKILNKFISASAVAVAALALAGCVSESPFDTTKEGTLRLSAELRGNVKSVVTRAADYDQAALENNLVVYVSKPGTGVIRKFIGLGSLQGSNIGLQTGPYVVEGWTGDSVTASFDKKFYSGYQPIEIKEGTNSFTLKCDIANVLASINSELVSEQVSNLQMEVWNTRGSLTFDSEMIASDPKGERKGYFMMPNGDNTLHYRISFKNEAGEEKVKEGEIENVQRAHDYQFILKADPSQITQGGVLVKVEIVEVPVIDEEVMVFPAPSFKATMNNGEIILDLDGQLDATKEENYSDISLRVLAYKGMPSLKLSFSGNFPGIIGGLSGLDIINDDPEIIPAAIKMEKVENEDNVANSSDEKVKVVEYWFNIPKSYIASLPASSEEYCITFDVIDGKGYSNQARLRWARSEEAVERLAPVGSYSQDEVIDYTAVKANSAVLQGALYDSSVTDFGIRIREQGAANWLSIPGSLTTAAATRADKKLQKYSVVATGLKPGTTYEYKAYAGDFEEAFPKTFKTESVFVIPDSSLEAWSTFSENSKVLLPGAGGVRTFWDSGNHGSATMNVTLTKNIENPVHSGSYSAQLRSQFVGIGASLGKFAAGNLFAGTYLKTDGTDGVLEFGRPYNGSHPSALRLWANYRPGIVEKPGSISDCTAEDKVAVGSTDKAQIYVALTTEPIEIKTKNTSESPRQLFNPNDSRVVAYGEITWSEAFGPDGVLKEIIIPLDYKTSAKTLKPTHLVIVCSASKFGDYFCGGEGSTMIVDDFELIYE